MSDGGRSPAEVEREESRMETGGDVLSPGAGPAGITSEAAREAAKSHEPDVGSDLPSRPERGDRRPPARMGGAVSLRDRRRRLVGVVFEALCGVATLVGVVALAVLLFDVVGDGMGALSVDFLTSFASRFPERAGIKAALWGSLWVISLTVAFSFPLGVGAAIYLEEYAKRGWLTRIIQTNISNLAGVPSIVYGILGLALFVRLLAFERSVLAGALTLTLLILPVIIIAAQEAIRAVPDSIRQAAYGLGATRWQVVSLQVLPMALPGILTGTILALSRAVGETAPLILVGAVGFLAFTPEGLLDRFTVLPIQIYYWVSRPQEEFKVLAAGGIIVLLVILLSMNAVAILLRNKYQSRQ